MNCENYLKLIDELIEGELDEKSADEVSSHVFDCQNCTAHFEMLERETQIYSHYLFDIEPPIDLQRKFEAKLAAEEKANLSTSHENFWAGILAFLRSNPAAFAAIVFVLFAVGFVLMNFTTKENTIEEAKTTTTPKADQFSASENIIASATPEKFEKPVIRRVENKQKTEKAKPELIVQPIAVKQAELIKKAVPKTKLISAVPKIELEEEAKLKQMQALETEAAKQIEKVELLLRAFRNAQMTDNGETYNVAYESQQARKLLQNNVALRQKAESYGTFFTGEILSRVEPYLLDIANLDAKPSPDQVLQIKDRVRNQNIIASLQMY